MTAESPAARSQRLRAIRICLRSADRTEANEPQYARAVRRWARKLTNKHNRTAIATSEGAFITTQPKGA